MVSSGERFVPDYRAMSQEQLIAEIERLREDQGRKVEPLGDSEARWHAIAKGSPDHIMLVDLDGKVLFINHTAPNHSGRTWSR